MTLPDGNESKDQAATGPERPADAESTPSRPADVEATTGGAEVPVGTALAETDVATDPFPVKADRAPEPVAPRSIKSILLDYSAHAAMIVGLIGFAWTVSDHVVTHPTAAQIEAPAAAGPRAAAPVATPEAEARRDDGKDDKRDEVSELRAANERMAKDVDALRAQLGTLQAALGREPTPDQVRALTGELEGVKAGLSTVKGETTTAIAALSGRLDKSQRELDKSQRETDAKVQRLAAGSLERQGVDTAATGSIAPAEPLADAKSAADGKTARTKPVPTKPSSVIEAHTSPTPVAKPATRLASAEKADDEAARPAVLPGWVVREVYQGVALIEGRRGSLEVVPGVSIPGAGVVKSIDRHGNGWTVTTTKGMLAYAATPRDTRRTARDYYPDPRYDW